MDRTERRPDEFKKVAAAVIEREGRVLIARRRGGPFAGFWEFPGGKIEAGETPEQGLERELAEELGIRAVAGGFVCSVRYHGPALAIELLVYDAFLVSGEPRADDHEEIRWAEPAGLDESAFSEPDRLVVRHLAARCRRPAGSET